MAITKIKNYTLSDIKDSIRYLLDKAAESPEVRQLAIEITQNNPDKIVAVYDWTRANLQYVSDPTSIELFTSPVKIVQDYKIGQLLAGDCDDHALLNTALLRAVGVQARVVLIDTVSNGLDHAYCEAYSEKLSKWISVDTSTDKIPLGWEISYKSKIIV